LNEYNLNDVVIYLLYSHFSLVVESSIYFSIIILCDIFRFRANV